MSREYAPDHVLVIAIDGVRYDCLQSANTPNIDAVATHGFLVPVQVDARNPTISGPVWATVAAGVYSDRHLIRSNDFHGHRLEDFPDFISRLQGANPDMNTMSVALWSPLLKDVDGGPVFAGGGYHPNMGSDVDEDDMDIAAVMDEAVLGHAGARLLIEDLAVSFVYLESPDAVAHALGTGDRYMRAIERADEQVGVLLAVIAARANREAERWTVIVVTDHGHRDEGGHGADSAVERTAWIAAQGPGIDELVGAAGIDHADIHPHILGLFGIIPEPEWGLEGVAFGARHAQIRDLPTAGVSLGVSLG